MDDYLLKIITFRALNFFKAVRAVNTEFLAVTDDPSTKNTDVLAIFGLLFGLFFALYHSLADDF